MVWARHQRRARRVISASRQELLHRVPRRRYEVLVQPGLLLEHPGGGLRRRSRIDLHGLQRLGSTPGPEIKGPTRPAARRERLMEAADANCAGARRSAGPQARRPLPRPSQAAAERSAGQPTGPARSPHLQLGTAVEEAGEPAAHRPPRAAGACPAASTAVLSCLAVRSALDLGPGVDPVVVVLAAPRSSPQSATGVIQ